MWSAPAPAAALKAIDPIGHRPCPPLLDRLGRPITYLRISVTDRCNLRCIYCMPEAGLQWIRPPEILTFEEIARVVEAGAGAGLRSIRLTGGEPLVRPDLPRLVGMLAAVPGIADISLSTNGLRLAEAAGALAAAGLRRVNISLDTLSEERFLAICRRPGLERVIAGIDAALAAGLSPVKLNCVVARGRNDDEISALASLTRERDLHVRFIEMMPVAENAALQRAAYVSSDEILKRLASDGELVPVDGPPGNGPAAYYAFRGARGTVGIISPMSHHYCERCNRVRLSADGRLRLCLFGDHTVDLRAALRAGASQEDLADLFRGAMPIKPARHHLRRGEAAGRMRAFSEIGG